MTYNGNNFNDFPETISAGHTITKNNRLSHLGEMPAVGGRFAGVWMGFCPHSLHV